MANAKTTQGDPVEVVTAFFAAIERADVAAVAEIYNDYVKVWHNFTRAEQGKTQNLEGFRR